MKPTPMVMFLLVACSMASSAHGSDRFPTRDQLNDPGRGIWAEDAADVLKPRQLLYEIKQDGRYRVGYNLIRESEGDVKGYFLRVTIINLSANAVVVANDVMLIDAENSVISATDRDTFLALAATLGGTKAPTSNFRRTARAASAVEDFDKAYLRGQSEGRMLRAAEDDVKGRRMTLWADSFWLKPTVELPPQGKISGVRVFLADPNHPLPLRIRLRVGDSWFEFTSRTQ